MLDEHWVEWSWRVPTVHGMLSLRYVLLPYITVCGTWRVLDMPWVVQLSACTCRALGMWPLRRAVSEPTSVAHDVRWLFLGCVASTRADCTLSREIGI